MTGFTPGRWVITHDNCGGGATIKSNGRTVAFTVEAKTIDGKILDQGEMISPKEAYANALLIQSAPELFEALLELASYANESLPSNTPEFLEGLFERIQVAAGVIGKARGE